VHEVQVNAGPDTSLCDGQTALLQGTASTTNILWSPATGLSDVTVLNPQFNNAESVEYVLVATDSFGCKASDTVLINIGKCESYLKVPQAFTPGSDGHNDLFTVFGKNINQYEIRIYNRWGELVYQSRDVNELNTGGWDGTYKGALQQTGTFVYYITARDSNNQPLEKKGNLTLIR
jgi:gliding motility-associated-like protein